MSLLKSLFSGDQEKNLTKGLEATRKSFFSKLGTVIAGKSTVDVALLDDLEEVLVTADVGVTTTLKIIDAIEARVAKDNYLGTKELSLILKEEISRILAYQQPPIPFSFSDLTSSFLIDKSILIAASLLFILGVDIKTPPFGIYIFSVISNLT